MTTTILRDALAALHDMTSRYAISDTDYGIVCNAAAALAAADADQAPDAGPWRYATDLGNVVSVNRHFLESDDFTHDVRLYISGDFADDAQREQYGRALADKLNAACPAPSDEAPHAKFADDFAYVWGLALSDAAMYVEGHCANGAHHAKAITNMPMPKITARPAPVGAAPVQDADEADADHDTIMRMGRMLAEIAITMKGEEAPRQRHGYADLPELVKVMAMEIDIYRTVYGRSIPEGWENGDGKAAPVGAVQAPAEGWQLVPTHPDQFMINAFIPEYHRKGGTESGCYRAMLAAAPAAPIGAEPDAIAWARNMDTFPEFTEDSTVGGYWMRKGFKVTKLYGHPAREMTQLERHEDGIAKLMASAESHQGDVSIPTPKIDTSPERVDSIDIERAFTDISDLIAFAFDKGHHELGYDPVAVLRGAVGAEDEEAEKDAALWRALRADTGPRSRNYPCLRDDLADWLSERAASANQKGE